MTDAIRVDAGVLRRLLAASAGAPAERSAPTLLIEFFASRCCTNVMVGDLQTRWLDTTPAAMVELGSVGGVRIVADPRIADLLVEAGTTLVESGGPLRRSIGVQLESPERWLAFLESPAARRPMGSPPASGDDPALLLR